MIFEILNSLALLVPDWQAGGGGRFGLGGGGGGGDGGDGLFWIFYFLIELAIEAPLIGVPLLILAVFVFFQGSRRGWFKHQERTIRKRAPRVRRRTSRRSAQDLSRKDPDFDEARFLARVREAFTRAQRSWCAQDLEPLRHFVTDGVFERFSMQVAEQQEDGWRQGMVGLRVHQLSILHVHSGRHFDTLTVHVPFEADIHRVDLESGARIRGSKIPRTQFSECWSFVRRSGARTRGEDGLFEGQCPNCGAPLRMNQSAQCGSCEAFVRSGQHDWVLAEITQGSEWRPEAEEELPGFAAHAASDPGLSVQLLEDRASVAFWRKAAADRRGEVEPLARVADDEFCEAYAAALRTPQDRARVYLAENAVGSVRTVGLLAGAKFDRAVVEVVWDGCRARVGADGRRMVESDRRMQRALFVFRRKAGVATRIEESFSTTFCRNCGAHDLGGLDPRCPYCEAPRSGPAWSWLLNEVVPDRTARALELRRELAGAERETRREDPDPAAAAPVVAPLAAASSADLLAWAAGLAREDGQLDAREAQALRRLAERLQVGPARLEALLSEPEAGAPPSPRDTFEARQWLKALTGVALADGSLSRGERRWLRQAAEGLGVRRGEFERLLGKVRGELFREARAARRD